METINKKAWVGTKAQYLTTFPEGTDRPTYITDLPAVEISNADMALALTTEAKFYKEGQILICSDDGAYMRGHLYQYSISGWTDITASGSSVKNKTIEVSLGLIDRDNFLSDGYTIDLGQTNEWVKNNLDEHSKIKLNFSAQSFGTVEYVLTFDVISKDKAPTFMNTTAYTAISYWNQQTQSGGPYLLSLNININDNTDLNANAIAYVLPVNVGNIFQHQVFFTKGDIRGNIAVFSPYNGTGSATTLFPASNQAIAYSGIITDSNGVNIFITNSDTAGVIKYGQTDANTELDLTTADTFTDNWNLFSQILKNQSVQAGGQGGQVTPEGDTPGGEETPELTTDFSFVEGGYKGGEDYVMKDIIIKEGVVYDTSTEGAELAKQDKYGKLVKVDEHTYTCHSLVGADNEGNKYLDMTFVFDETGENLTVVMEYSNEGQTQTITLHFTKNAELYSRWVS